MQTNRIDLEGNAGRVTIERDAESGTIRIDSIVRDPARGQQAWKTWEPEATISDEDLFKIAAEAYQRTEGRPGTNSDIHDLFREMQRFQN